MVSFRNDVSLAVDIRGILDPHIRVIGRVQAWFYPCDLNWRCVLFCTRVRHSTVESPRHATGKGEGERGKVAVPYQGAR
jgi:hypothetical protein